MARHRVPLAELDVSLRALIATERIDSIHTDPFNSEFVIIFTDDRIETRPT